MAEQNRKTADQVRAREAAKREVDRFLAYLQGLESIDAIAREGRSLMGMLAEFEGDPPASSGFSGFCVLADKIDRVRLRHMPDEFARAFDRLAGIARRSPLQVQALCVDRWYRNRTRVAIDPFTEQRYEIHWDDRACADYLRCTVKVFQRRVSKGYCALEEVLGYRQQQAA